MAAANRANMGALASREDDARGTARAASSESAAVLKEVIARTHAAEAAAEAAAKERDASLKSVTVNKADVALLWKTYGCTIPVADRLLRMNGGDLNAALRALYVL